jgi:hypothetical protein
MTPVREAHPFWQSAIQEGAKVRKRVIAMLAMRHGLRTSEWVVAPARATQPVADANICSMAWARLLIVKGFVNIGT